MARASAFQVTLARFANFAWRLNTEHFVWLVVLARSIAQAMDDVMLCLESVIVMQDGPGRIVQCPEVKNAPNKLIVAGQIVVNASTEHAFAILLTEGFGARRVKGLSMDQPAGCNASGRKTVQGTGGATAKAGRACALRGGAVRFARWQSCHHSVHKMGNAVGKIEGIVSVGW